MLTFTPWGFKLRVVGGNPEAARRAGLKVGGLGLAAMAVGGALAGLGGMLEVAGVEGRLRPDMLVGFGYIGFLASLAGPPPPAQDHRARRSPWPPSRSAATASRWRPASPAQQSTC